MVRRLSPSAHDATGPSERVRVGPSEAQPGNDGPAAEKPHAMVRAGERQARRTVQGEGVTRRDRSSQMEARPRLGEERGTGSARRDPGHSQEACRGYQREIPRPAQGRLDHPPPVGRVSHGDDPRDRSRRPRRSGLRLRRLVRRRWLDSPETRRPQPVENHRRFERKNRGRDREQGTTPATGDAHRPRERWGNEEASGTAHLVRLAREAGVRVERLDARLNSPSR